jgi:hypothetical protein
MGRIQQELAVPPGSWRWRPDSCRPGDRLGRLLFFGLPILAVPALVTLVGIPLGLGLLAALALIYALGYSATACILGRSIVRAPTAWVVASLVGWPILRVVTLVPDPGWPGLVRGGGVGAWCPAGGHLAGPLSRPSCSGSHRLIPAWQPRRFRSVGLILALGRRHQLAQATRTSLTGPPVQTAFCSGAATNCWRQGWEQK